MGAMFTMKSDHAVPGLSVGGIESKTGISRQRNREEIPRVSGFHLLKLLGMVHHPIGYFPD
jgi:hypothetical protein